MDRKSKFQKLRSHFYGSKEIHNTEHRLSQIDSKEEHITVEVVFIIIT